MEKKHKKFKYFLKKKTIDTLNMKYTTSNITVFQQISFDPF